jgi:hypothetical protein
MVLVPSGYAQRPASRNQKVTLLLFLVRRGYLRIPASSKAGFFSGCCLRKKS